MSFGQRLQEIRDGFERPFWLPTSAKSSSAFLTTARSRPSRISSGKAEFSTEQTGTLTGIFGGMVWFLAIFGGAVADRLGFRRALSLAYLTLATAYFLIGSVARHGLLRFAISCRSGLSLDLF
jgi:dipeptide/tripeptide permease